MDRAHARRGLRVTVTVLAVGLFTAAISAAGGLAHAAVHRTSQAPKACVSKARHGRFSGVVSAVPVDAACFAHNTSDAANGTPPLLLHGGPVMGTPSSRPVVVTPIYWDPAGHPMSSSYKNIINTYLGDVAAASGQHTNVFSTLNEYFGSNGTISYQVRLGTPINDTSPLPASGCMVTAKDTSGIYADNSGYNACLDDAQVIAETSNVVSARGLPVDLRHIYVMFLPKHVESCFFAGSTDDREELLHDQLSPERGLLRLPQPGAERHGVREHALPDLQLGDRLHLQ